MPRLFPFLATAPLLFASAAAMAMPAHRVDHHVGFTLGQSSYTNTPFALDGRGSAEAATALAPFQAGPFDGVTHAGLDVGGSIVTHHVRVSLDHRWDVPQFDMASSTSTLASGGTATARGLKLSTWRVGIGGELPTDEELPTVFAEIVGQHQRISADLALPDGPAHYSATGFGYGIQGGVQVPFNEAAHIYAAGEYGIYGQPTWNAMIGIGVHFGES